MAPRTRNKVDPMKKKAKAPPKAPKKKALSAAKKAKNSKVQADGIQTEHMFNYGGNYGNYGNCPPQGMDQMNAIEDSGNGGPWVTDESVPPTILSERRSIGRKHTCYLRKVCLFSESTGRRWWPKQFAVEKPFFNRKIGRPDVYVMNVPLDILPALAMAATELNKVADMPHSAMMYTNPLNSTPPLGQTANQLPARGDGPGGSSSSSSSGSALPANMMTAMEQMIKNMLPSLVQTISQGEEEEEEEDDDEEEEEEDNDDDDGDVDEGGNEDGNNAHGQDGPAMIIDDEDVIPLGIDQGKNLALAKKANMLIPN